MSDRPLRMRYRCRPGGGGRVEVAGSPMRLGFDDGCEVTLEGDDGPPILFEIHKLPGPIQIATRVPPGELAHYVELAVDGTPLDGPVRTLQAGSRVDVVDKATRRRYSLVLDPPPPWVVRPRVLAVAMLVLTALGVGYGAYLLDQLERAAGTINRTQSQVEQQATALRETHGRIESAEGRLAGAIRALELERTSAEQIVRAEFDARLDRMARRAREALEQISEEDSLARDALRLEVAGGIQALRADFAERMVASYRRLKDLELEVLDSVAARVEALEPATERFKRVYAMARDAVVFVHTRYTVRFEPAGVEQSYDSFGTGFLAGPDGLALTAQHVLFPWRYESELLLLVSLGAASVADEDVRWSVWLTGSPVARAGDGAPGLREETAFRSDGEERTVRFLHAPDPALSVELVASPAGMVELLVPRPGASDIAVFRLEGHPGPLPHLEVARAAAALEALDDLLVVGYPFSRLQDGVAIPQAVRGFVRRVGAEVIEVDLPLHPGLSGAPLLDGQGRVVGLASATYQSPLYGVAAARESLLEALDAASHAPAAQ